MIVFRQHPDKLKQVSIILLFGAGLIGNSILNSVTRQFGDISSYLPFDWNCPEQCKKDAEIIFQYLTNALALSSSYNPSPGNIALVWCAGKVGFAATEKNMDDELISYGIFLDLVRRIRGGFSESRIVVHLLSSTGGLFEGQRLVHEESRPQPKRFYGQLKYVQEQRMMELEGDIAKKIYRPASVYGFAGHRQRMGLIPTLITQGIKNRVSTIFGNLGTLRDYVLNEDIGNYIGKKLFHDCDAGNTSVYLLGSGKPSSIYEIRHFVEQVIGRKIYLEFRVTPQTENAMDITINSSALPVDWAPTDIKSGIRFVKECIVSGYNCRVRGLESIST